MKFQVPFFLLFIFFFHFSVAQEIDVQHYRFDLELSDQSDSIKGKATITIQFLKDAAQLQLNLKSAVRGKGMTAYQVLEKGVALSSLHRKDTLSVFLPVPVKKNEKRTFEIFYAGIPADGLIISKNKWGDRTFFSDNWPNRAQHWLPCNDRPDDKASVEFLVTAPAYYLVVSNGVMAGEKTPDNSKKQTYWREMIPLPTKVMAIGAARFIVGRVDSAAGVPVTAWVYPQDMKKGFHDYAMTAEILDFFTHYIGPYPFRKLANVQSKTIFGGMENASAIFYAEETVTGKRVSGDLMAHEIAHQWFGNMATEKSFPHLWLSEGFATYLTNVYIENKWGKDSARKRLEKEREAVVRYARTHNTAVVDSTSELMDLLNANSYQKGGWVLHMLRMEVGDSIFKKSLQLYYEHFKGGNAETSDFQRVAEQVSGKSLDTFFKQWLYEPGIPQLQIRWQYSEGKINLTVQQTGRNSFRFPLELAVIDTDGKQRTYKINVVKPAESFLLPAKDKPLGLLIDPDIKLLFSGKIAEVK